MRMLKKTSALAALLALGMLAAPVQAATVLKVASIAPPKTPWITALEKWRDNLLASSKGEIELQIFPSGQLGNEFDVFKQVARGRVDIGSFSGAPMTANFPELALMSTPFLFDNAATIDCIYDQKLASEFANIVSEKKMKVLQWGETGWVYTYAMDDISNPDKAKGYKIRVAPTPMSKLLWESVNAAGIEVPYIEVPAALQTGMVKGGESTVLAFMAFGLGKVVPNFLRMRQYHQAGALLIGQKKWDSFSADQQKMILEAMPDPNESRAVLRGMSEQLMQKFAAAGGQVRDMKDGTREKWAELVKANWPKYVSGLGGRSEELWPKVLAAKKACEG